MHDGNLLRSVIHIYAGGVGIKRKESQSGAPASYATRRVTDVRASCPHLSTNMAIEDIGAATLMDDIISTGEISDMSSISDMVDLADDVAAADEDTTTENADTPIHHKEFYLKDQHIKLKAGVTVYSVHAYFFTREARELVKRSCELEDCLVILDDVTSEDL
jgi:hypothetical protein